MRSPGRHILRLLNRRSRNGQSILIVAFAFIVLIAFVGIAVDVALLFVRYSSLRRAVDSAAIAAAGQVREGTDYPTLQAVAEQFVGLQGNINPDTVRVETCETEIHDYIMAAAAGAPPAGGPPRSLTGQQALGEILANTLRPSELCRADPQKLVRVSAQVNSPTTFLSILGWGTVLLEASSVSQTAVLDVALVLDTSRSLAFATYAEQPNYARTGATNADALRTFRPFLDALAYNGTWTLQPYPAAANGVDDWPNADGMHDGRPAMRYECWEDRWQGLTPNNASNYAWGGCCNDPSTQSNPDGTVPYRRYSIGTIDPIAGWTGSYGVVDGVPAFYNNGDIDPATGAVISNAGLPPYITGQPYDPQWYIYDAPGMSEAQIMTGGQNPRGEAAATLINGRPDGNFADLVCRPFKDVRDAARRFIRRLDFVRGDRLVLVTFDSEARMITPSGATIPVLTDKATAVRTLDQQVGMSVNPNGRQTGCISRRDTRLGINPLSVSSYWTVAQCGDTNTGGGIRMGRAALTNPAWIRRDSVWVMVLLSDGVANRTPSFDELSAEFAIQGVERDWLTVPTNDRATSYTLQQIFEFCDPGEDTNGNGWLDPGEDRNGNGMLDGPHPNYGLRPHLCVPPYWTGQPWGNFASDASGNPDPIYSFGFCPWYTFCDQSGVTPTQAQCTSNDTQPPWWTSNPATSGRPFREPAPPQCVDWSADTRHRCSDLEGVINSPNAYCDPRYDPEDYARDQADFAGLIDYTSQTRGSFIAMFTLFFQPEPGDMNDYILGVKLLRYVADAGDNGIINNRLQAWYRMAHEAQLLSDPLSAPPEPPRDAGGNILPGDQGFYDVTNLDPRGDSCYAFDTTMNSTLAYDANYQAGQPGYEAAARANCGQFWFADTLAAVDAAFTEIASRLFTRLSR